VERVEAEAIDLELHQLRDQPAQRLHKHIGVFVFEQATNDLLDRDPVQTAATSGASYASNLEKSDEHERRGGRNYD
jgi:hypothetical protein